MGNTGVQGRILARIALGWALLFFQGVALAGDPYRVAVLAFRGDEEPISAISRTATDLVMARLSAEPQVRLVERQEIADILGELGLSLSGLVKETEVVRVGKLTGAQIMVTGRVSRVDDDLLITARLIGVETSRVSVALVQGPGSGALLPLAEDLAQQIATAIIQQGPTLVADAAQQEDPPVTLTPRLAGKKLPSIAILVQETVADLVREQSVTETELAVLLKASGFQLYEDESGALVDWAEAYRVGKRRGFPKQTKADVLIVGEALGSFLVRRGELVSSRARVQLRALDTREGEVLAVARNTKTAVDLSAPLATGKALRENTAAIAPDFVVRLVDAWNR